ncbi:uncharacterized protein LOC143849290 [Tasmannia lanceolata]|uniref:uncharacterized protein LOC143849290 n=1 Tax=Tasmannia lanceolata TaxID=3420 RepID=UPI004062C8BD
MGSYNTHHSSSSNKLQRLSREGITIGDHGICVGFHEERNYLAWQWHGHIILSDQENGYTRKHIYGHYYERVELEFSCSDDDKKDEEEEQKRRRGGDLGFRPVVGFFMESEFGFIEIREITLITIDILVETCDIIGNPEIFRGLHTAFNANSVFPHVILNNSTINSHSWEGHPFIPFQFWLHLSGLSLL